MYRLLYFFRNRNIFYESWGVSIVTCITDRFCVLVLECSHGCALGMRSAGSVCCPPGCTLAQAACASPQVTHALVAHAHPRLRVCVLGRVHPRLRSTGCVRLVACAPGCTRTPGLVRGACARSKACMHTWSRACTRACIPGHAALSMSLHGHVLGCVWPSVRTQCWAYTTLDVCDLKHVCDLWCLNNSGRSQSMACTRVCAVVPHPPRHARVAQ